ncbi:hypothetical protein D5S17_30795 [Pseudonocardiaceae bacterium YIM PH 21723]|nr:hypothetical protein D5S17_30795 [Pseudonocardiaceae bacterium YIM PH 21723]
MSDDDLTRQFARPANLGAEDPLGWPVDELSERETPFDIAAVRADDELLDAIGSGHASLRNAMFSDELGALLLAWRRDVDAEPIGQLIDVETAAATIAAARNRGRNRFRLLVPLASAAAVLAIAATGVGVAARDAGPGSSLFGVTKVLYSDKADSRQAAASVQKFLETAQMAKRQGKLADANKALQQANAQLSKVSEDEDKSKLKAQLEETDKQPTGPTTPVTSQPTPTGRPDSGTTVKPSEPSSPVPSSPLPSPSTSPVTGGPSSPSVPSSPPSGGSGTPGSGASTGKSGGSSSPTGS